MINYSVDTGIRKYVIFVISAMSIGGSQLTKNLITTNFLSISSLALFGVIYFFFKNYGWSLFGLNKILGLPNLNGAWKGTIERRSIENNVWEEIEITADITQNWSMIAMSIENSDINSMTGTTKSRLNAASIMIKNPNTSVFSHIWQYDNGMGCCNLHLKNNIPKMQLKGNYISTAFFEGTITLEKC